MPMVALWLARISSISRARRSAVLPLPIRPSTTGLMRARLIELILAHGNAAGDLRQVFAEADTDQVFLKFAECAAADHSLGVGGDLAHRLDIRGEPGQAVRGALLAVEEPADRVALHNNPLAHLGDGIREQGIERRDRFAAEFDQVMPGGGTGSGNRHEGPQVQETSVIPAEPATLRVQCTKAKALENHCCFGPAAGEKGPDCYKINHSTLC
jgi:hypothetical protein